MTNGQNLKCPECGSELENGFIGYGSGLIWLRQALQGWRRFFPFATAKGRFVFGSWTSSGMITTIPARKCRACEAVVLPKST